MSTMGDGLNAGAATFTPDTRNANEMNDDSMMDEIEAELENSHNGGGGYNGSAYPDLPPHADEFWFPECRNCTCCNGYKHGCQCCAKEGLRSCKCTGPGPAVAPQGGWMPAVPGPTGGGYNSNAAAAGGRGGYAGRGGGGRGGGGRGGPPPPCRFFHSPGGCRFGDNCRFSHV